MLLNPFRFFLNVVRLGSVRAASEVAGLAPSSVSRQIQILEQQIGTALLVRTPGGASPTAAGELVADFANNIILDYDRLRADLNDLRGTGRIKIRLGVIESMASGEVLRLIADMRLRQANVIFGINVLRAPDIATAVRQGVCDIGIAIDITPTSDIRIIGRVPEQMVVALHPDHSLAKRSGIQLAELAETPLALHEPDHSVRQLIDRACRMRDMTLEPVVATNSLEALRDFARIGAGAALLTRRGIAADLAAGRLVAVPIEDDGLAFEGLTVFASARRRPSRALRLCEDELMRHLKAGAC